MPQVLTVSLPLQGLSRTAARLRLRAGELGRGLGAPSPRETIGFGLLGLIPAAAIAGSAHSTPELPAAATTPAPPAPPPMLIRQLAPDQALQVNQQIPVAQGPNPAAQPFVFRGNADARKQ